MNIDRHFQVPLFYYSLFQVQQKLKPQVNEINLHIELIWHPLIIKANKKHEEQVMDKKFFMSVELQVYAVLMPEACISIILHD